MAVMIFVRLAGARRAFGSRAQSTALPSMSTTRPLAAEKASFGVPARRSHVEEKGGGDVTVAGACTTLWKTGAAAPFTVSLAVAGAAALF
jgi:hypothetical protein